MYVPQEYPNSPEPPALTYMLSFDNKDLRRDLTCEMFRYENSGMTNIVQKPIAALTVYCGKWNRLFMATPLGSTSNKGTGINYTYMRYADVMLMYAEAANENHNGPTPQAKEALKKVRNRAFAAEDQPEMVDTYQIPARQIISSMLFTPKLPCALFNDCIKEIFF